MKLINTVRELQDVLSDLHDKEMSIGFVPTMGALHEGHLSLVSRCADENDVCVVSVFVNPTQFNDKEDLLKYPRTLEADALLLRQTGCQLLFAPSVEEMYPEPDTRVFDFGTLERVMEGEHRPGHFNGVAQIVSKLFDAVMPRRAYFGEKDFQQLAIIRAMVRESRYPVEIVACPTVREENGLAMSSRNARLGEEGRKEAALISQTLLESTKLKTSKSAGQLRQWISDRIGQESSLTVEYVDIVDADTLQSIDRWDDTDRAVACVAVFCRGVRLIDNIIYC